VTIKEGSVTLGTVTADGTGAWTFSPSGLANGAHTITVSETDTAGNTGTASLTFTLDTAAPAVSIALVQDTGSSSTDKITSNAALKGTADPNATVTIKEGSVTLGTVTADGTGAWTFSPSGLANGAHTITVSEVDTAGNTGTASLAFTLDTAAPAVSIALAQDSGTSSTDSLTSNPQLQGTADPNAAVTIKEGSVTLGTATADGTGAWTFSPSGLANGAHTITVSETDAAGNTGTASLTFTLDTVAPAVSIALAQDTGSSSTDKITSNGALKGTADPNATVTIKEGSITLGTVTADGTGAWTFLPSGLANGAHAITVSEIDTAGNIGTASLTFTLDTTAPAVSIALAQDTGTSSTDNLTSNAQLKGTADPNATVTIKEGGVTLGTATANASGAWTFSPSGLANGAHTITVSETDAAGNIGTASLTFTLDTTASVVSVALAQDSGTSSTDKVTSNAALNGTSDPNATVTIKEGSVTLGTVTADGTGAWTFSPSGLANSAHTITVSETDTAGNIGTASLTFTLDTAAPAVSIALAQDTGTSSADNVTSNGSLKGTADPNATVTIKEGSVTLGTVTADGTGAWTFSPSGLANGAHTITVSETDTAGNTGTASLTFTLDTAAPAVSIALVQDTGSSSTDKITSNAALKGTADPNATVTIKEGSVTLGTVTADGTGAWTFSPSGLANGAHTITVSEVDTAGNTGTASLAFTLDTAAPAVSIALAQDSGTSSTDSLTSNPQLQGTADPNAAVTIKEGSVTLGTATADGTGAWTFSPSGLANGAHTITVSETDAAGNTGTASLTFTLDTVAPAVSIALAQDTGSSSTDKITSNGALKGTADPNATVTIKEGSITLGTVTADGTGAWTFLPSGLANGAHAITVSEIDTAGNIGTASLTFTLDTTAPAVSIALAQDTGTSSSDNVTSNATLTGLVDSNAVVTISEGAIKLGTATADNSGAWTFSPSGLATGAHTITATEVDAAGNSSSANFSLTFAPLTDNQIDALYVSALGRHASTAEQAAWSALSANGGATSNVQLLVAQSAETTAFVDPVVRLYQGAFGRVPDSSGGLSSGLAVNANVLRAGHSLIDLAQAFVDSAEFAARYGSTAVTSSLISAFYHNILGRTPSNAEVSAWMVTHLDAAHILVGFTQSTEFIGGTKTAIDNLLVQISNGLTPTGPLLGQLPPSQLSVTSSADATGANSGGAIIFNIASTNGAADAGKAFVYTWTGSAADQVGAPLTGTVLLNAQGSATLAVTLAAGVTQVGVGMLTLNVVDQSDTVAVFDGMSVPTLLQSLTPSIVSDGGAWHVDAIGDFDGDGSNDVVLQNSNGEVAAFLMNGANIKSADYITANNVPAVVGADWRVAGVADYNSDGKADILWQNGNGALMEWLMNGTQVASSYLPQNADSLWTTQPKQEVFA